MGWLHKERLKIDFFQNKKKTLEYEINVQILLINRHYWINRNNNKSKVYPQACFEMINGAPVIEEMKRNLQNIHLLFSFVFKIWWKRFSDTWNADRIGNYILLKIYVIKIGTMFTEWFDVSVIIKMIAENNFRSMSMIDIRYLICFNIIRVYT